MKIAGCVLVALILVRAELCAADQPHRIGVSLPLSGAVAPMGEGFRKGFVLFQQDFPNSNVEFLFEDHKYDGKSAVSSLYKLSQSDRAEMVIVWGNMPSQSSAPVAEQSRLPMIGVTMDPVAKGRQYVTSLGPPIKRLITRVEEKFKEWQLKKLAAVSIDIGDAIAGMQMLNDDLGGHLLLKTIANEEADFKTLLTSLRSKRIDGLFLILLPEQALTFVRQAAQLKYKPKIIGGDVFGDSEFQKEALRYISELWFVYGAVQPPFIERLREKWGNTSYFFESACGYALAAIASRLLSQKSSDKSPFERLKSINFTDLPIIGLQLLDSPEYGLHFEADGQVYQAKLPPLHVLKGE